ncbi:Trihydroxynaphthalene reductase, variant 2 [Metarhizium acridum]|uniref:Trihydroxynaphthalene reductase, variant 2 n=1 Tax=Metarhizium acridum TaxID=92637 RepID=UPI001C6C6346|nr:Trihydroxynaphthalene reductase, variant 2 [Metarhizium acridum]
MRWSRGDLTPLPPHIEVSRRLRSSVRPAKTAARLRGTKPLQSFSSHTSRQSHTRQLASLPTVSTTVMESLVIKTPCSSANIGPGFDVIGLALTVYLELHVTIDRSKTSTEHPLNCIITYEGQGEGTEDISLDPQSNLITRVALYVLRCHDQRAFPVETHVHIKNPIPLGRGLGSSGAAVVAGVMLGKEAGGLKHLDLDRLFDYCLMIERHPDNVGAALFGGFVGTYLMPLNPEDAARIEIPLSEVLPSPAGGVDTGKKPPSPPVGIGHHIKFPWAKEIKAVAIIPDFIVPTASARAVLPEKYPRQDVVRTPCPRTSYAGSSLVPCF